MKKSTQSVPVLASVILKGNPKISRHMEAAGRVHPTPYWAILKNGQERRIYRKYLAYFSVYFIKYNGVTTQIGMGRAFELLLSNAKSREQTTTNQDQLSLF